MYFSAQYIGPLVVGLKLALNADKCLRNMHPSTLAKILKDNFSGILSIIPGGPNKMFINFNSIKNANICLASAPIMGSNSFTPYIPYSLLYSYGVIEYDGYISNDDFWEGYECLVEIIDIKRIMVKRNDMYVPSRFIKITFKSFGLPKKISIFNVSFKVVPYIRSPLQCYKCLRFGHVQYVCFGIQRCSHCGLRNHDQSSCRFLDICPPNCANCHLPHNAKYRLCRERTDQKEILRTMAFKNVAFNEARRIKNTDKDNVDFKNIVQ